MNMGLKHLSDFRVIFYKDHAQFDFLFKSSFTKISKFLRLKFILKQLNCYQEY